jgi:CheY-like chemotaxis protein
MNDREGSMSAVPWPRASGFGAHTALSGSQRLRLLIQNSVKLVALDYEMPSMNGDFVGQAIRRSKPELLIILFTGILDDFPYSLRQNVNGVVSKSDFGGPLAVVSKLIKKSPGNRGAT